ncbi:unnamed protein product [Tuber melanosporum]|uniref:(Perigord truffle) hypothetical protein n=1 Tax=Tuber melanosporum (strain Mel28) TaxID=656061 RepID=D5GL72_TUBMM|nr:uncharacterized protein GSTUM_00010036001 [Tuber melanosporum]CAZ85265.1 unnamed protein product [Tuber melanosporum]
MRELSLSNPPPYYPTVRTKRELVRPFPTRTPPFIPADALVEWGGRIFFFGGFVRTDDLLYCAGLGWAGLGPGWNWFC